MFDESSSARKARIVSFRDGGLFINKSRLGMLMVGAIRQLAQRVDRLESVDI
jgi:hypothetical protein